MCERTFEMSKLMEEHLPSVPGEQLGDASHLEAEHCAEGLESHPTGPFSRQSCAGTSSKGSNEADWSTARSRADPS